MITRMLKIKALFYAEVAMETQLTQASPEWSCLRGRRNSGGCICGRVFCDFGITRYTIWMGGRPLPVIPLDRRKFGRWFLESFLSERSIQRSIDVSEGDKIKFQIYTLKLIT
jgi:hypothetical protein